MRQKGNLVASVWRDRRLVYVMSTNSDPTTPTTVQRREKDGTRSTITCPTNVVAYNKYMGELTTLINCDTTTTLGASPGSSINTSSGLCLTVL